MSTAGSDKPSPGVKSARRLSFFVVFAGAVVRLSKPVVVFGRSPACEFTIPNDSVSRVHARLHVRENDVVLEDLGSSNGTFVNERRVRGSVHLQPGDSILIGTEEISFFCRDPAEPFQSEPPTLDAEEPERASRADAKPPVQVLPDGQVRVPSTLRADAFAHVGRLADKMLALGRAAEAVRLLTDHIENVLDGARRGSALESTLVDTTSRYALRLAEATGNGRWVDRAIELHSLATRPFAEATLEQLECALPMIDGVSEGPFVAYRRALLARRSGMTVLERVLVRRFESLEVPLR